MATPPDSTSAFADSEASLTALQTAADNAFISDAAAAIANAIELGQTAVVLHTTKYCNIKNLQDFFVNLGYQVIYLDRPNPNLDPYSPASLFGPYYVAYWQNSQVPYGVHNPARIKLIWAPPHPLPWPWP